MTAETRPVTPIPETAAPDPAPAALRVGHINLNVADIGRAVAFYRDVLGLDVMQYYGEGRAAFLSAGGYHHHVALSTRRTLGGSPPPPGHTGMYHVAFVYPDRKALARAYQRVAAAGIAVIAFDHGVSEAVYFDDPDGHGIELYWDRPQASWPYRESGILNLRADPFDPGSLLSALDEG